jgi:hypothetical protein
MSDMLRDGWAKKRSHGAGVTILNHWLTLTLITKAE